ncbi:MAG: DUF4340 domain-containing protein [Lentimicrobiaceae bacterium]|nr:DUF4340 domain-containing protein [Lentimicrobiaceae bacterium]MCB9023448.1 DUF4340 domain-containing protein [Lentimicrobiaceae bacterium]MCO5265366.1 DUF4340 domain-containing protein [Lentimicrobium sp.]HPG32877.1 DUF4340 domain-containing protein [Lentimicrobium sp.]
MRKNRIIILVTLLLAVVAGLLMLNKSKSTLDRKISDFAVSDTASVTRIFMSDKADNKVLLARKPDGTWSLNDKYDAHVENVNTFLTTISNLEVREPVAKAAHNNIITLLASRSVKVEIYQQSYRINLGSYHFFPYEKLAKTYYIGDATMDNAGTYALLEGADTPVILYMPGLRGFVATRFSTAETDWRVHTVFNKKLPDIKEIKVEFTQKPEESFKVINNNNESLSLYKLTDNQLISRYDTLQLMAFVNAFRNIRYETLLNDMEPHKMDSIVNSTPLHRITLELKDGTKQTATTFGRMLPVPEIDVFDGSTVTYDRDRMYALVNNDKDFVMVQFFVFDKILMPLSLFAKNGQ